MFNCKHWINQDTCMILFLEYLEYHRDHSEWGDMGRIMNNKYHSSIIHKVNKFMKFTKIMQINTLPFCPCHIGRWKVVKDMHIKNIFYFNEHISFKWT